MRVEAAAALLMASLLTVAAATGEDSGPTLQTEGTQGDEVDSSTYDFVVQDQKPATDTTVTPVGDGTDHDEQPSFVMSYRVLDVDPSTGEECTATRWIVGYDDTARGAAADAVRLAEGAYAAAAGDPPPPPCSGLIIDEGEVADTATDIVADELDPATPFVQPNNEAITGLRSFLTTNVESNRTEMVEVELFGRTWDVEVAIEGVHTVDWGDGTIDTGVTGDGGPWHEGEPQPGDITHTYIDAGTYDLVVTTDWTVTATLVATGVSASQTLSTTSDAVPVTVDEVRSARDR